MSLSIPVGDAEFVNLNVSGATTLNTTSIADVLNVDILTVTPQYATPLTGANIVSTGSLLVINPAATISTLTITFPANPTNGQMFRVACTQIVSTLTVAGATLQVPITSLAANSHYLFSYCTPMSKWIQV